MKPASLGAGQCQGLIAPVRTTRFTGGTDYNECCMDGCPKHKDKCPYDGQYLFAMLKDTPYCPYEDIATYEYE